MIKRTAILTIFIIIISIIDGKADELPIHGFIEYTSGTRIVDDPEEENGILLSETRIQLELDSSMDRAEFLSKTDIVYDDIKGSTDIKVREGYIILFPADIFEIKAGRQILTWGTGEYLFINDLFPKDWQSFFIGRDDEYLKGPSNSIRFSIFPEIFDIDIVWTPVFTPDTFITGEKLSYFNTLIDSKAGDKKEIETERPDRDINNSEWALRLSKNINGSELSLYAYRGFYKRPLGYDDNKKVNIFPELTVYGTSIRGQLFGGIGNIEIGYYDSTDDRNGENPFIENSDIKGLAGYSKELFQDISLGTQYFIEYMIDYNEYKETYPANPSTRKDRVRHLFTANLTKLLMMQTMRLSLFTFYSPSDEDAHIRPSINYKWTDQITIVIGGNLFYGKKPHTFFGQLDDNTNIYTRLRYGF